VQRQPTQRVDERTVAQRGYREPEPLRVEAELGEPVPLGADLPWFLDQQRFGTSLTGFAAKARGCSNLVAVPPPVFSRDAGINPGGEPCQGLPGALSAVSIDAVVKHRSTARLTDCGL
jgi:hypothetical protein